MTSCVRLLLILSGVHLTQAYNSSNKGVPVGVPPPRVSQLCGKIPPSHVWDVQWSGNSSATMEPVIFWGTPYISGVGRLTVEPADYFTLTKKTDAEYQLNHYSSDDSLKTTFPEGSVKSNADVVFYMARGYNTLTAITKKDYQRWDLANFSNLQLNSSAWLLEGACMQQACTTRMGHSCVFPFVYEGTTYNSCTKSHSAFLWCATETDESGKFIGKWDVCSKGCLEIATTTPAPTPAPTPTPAHTPEDLCGKIPPSHVWDVQWSGNSSATMESVIFWDTPYISGVGRLTVEPTDYFTLTKKTGAEYQLKHYSSDDSLKTTFPEGSVKSNADVVFYMARGYNTLTAITKKDYQRWDLANFSNLQLNSSALWLESACMQQACTTTMGHACVFPFVYEGTTYNSCAKSHSGFRWCALDTDASGKYTGGLWGYCSKSCLEIATTTPAPTPAPTPTPAHTPVDLCGKIPPSRVWDVQWSGSPSDTEELMSGFNTPYIAGIGRLSVEPTDYFTLTKTAGMQYQLKHYGSDDSLKTTFPEGSVKSNPDVVFYMVHGWYGTAITKIEHKRGDSVAFANLKFNPAVLVEGACRQQAPAPTPAPTLVDVCGKIPPSRVWDVQWSDNPSAIEESLSGFNKPYVSGVGRLSVEPTDYFTLTKTTGTQFHFKHNTLTKKTGTEYQLKHYGSDDSLKTTFPEGSVKANADVVLYIVRGWYATAITKKEHKMWDSDTFSNLQLQPSAWLLEGACMQQACTTRMGDACVFPFVYEGTTYNSCTKARYSSPWCATRTDSHRKYIGKWGVCSNECHLSEPRCGQTTKVGCLGGDEDDCKPFNAACVNNKCVCNSGYCAIASIQNGFICESMSANTTTTVSLQDLLMTATTSTTTIMSSPVCSQMTTTRCSHGLFKNFCDFRFRATCDFEVGHCACKPGLCASGRWCVWDRNAETSTLSQIDGEADRGRHAVVEAVMTVTLAATVLGVMASFAVYLKRHRQSSPGLTPLM